MPFLNFRGFLGLGASQVNAEQKYEHSNEKLIWMRVSMEYDFSTPLKVVGNKWLLSNIEDIHTEKQNTIWKWNRSKKTHYDQLVKEMGKIFGINGMQNRAYSDIPY